MSVPHPECMTSQQRINALLTGQPLDRVPLYLMAKGFSANCTGFDLASVYHDVKKSLWSQVWTDELIDADSLVPRLSYHSGMAVEFGAEIEFPTGEWAQSPSVKQRPVNSEEDVEKLKLPEVNKTGDGYVAAMLEFGKLADKLGLPIVPHTGTPLTQTENLCGSDLLMRWMLKRPELVHQLLQLVTAFLFEVVKSFVEAFGTERLIVYQAGSVESNQLISPRQFEQFAFPYIKDLNERIVSLGVKHIFCHICGEQNMNLPYWEQIPLGEPGLVSIGHEIDLTTAIKSFGDRCVIVGNLKTAIIQEGNPQQVYELARQCIEKGKQAPRGYVLAPGCELPPKSPPYNVYTMRKAIDDFGWYD